MQYSRNTNSVLRPSLSPWIAESTLGSGLFKNFLFFFNLNKFSSFDSGTYGIVECVRHINSRQILARKTIKLTSKQEEENELPATAVREIAVVKSIQHENIIK